MNYVFLGNLLIFSDHKSLGWGYVTLFYTCVLNSKYSFTYFTVTYKLRVLFHNQLINRLHANKATLEENLNEQETKVLDILQDIQQGLRDRLSLCTNLSQMSSACVNKFSNTSRLKVRRGI